MPLEQAWGNYFKSEIKAAGFKLVAQEKVSISSASDTGIHAYVRVTPPLKVQLTAEDVASSGFIASCTCPVAKKSQFCKHVWAVLLCVAQKHPDFLAGKASIEKPEHSSGEAASTPREDYKAAAKQRASDYRKEQYQKQKLRMKEAMKGRKERETPVRSKSMPAEVEEALVYFSTNGFPMAAGPVEETLNEAKKKLSRVFHPDKGGTTEEMVELNKNCEILLQFLMH